MTNIPKSTALALACGALFATACAQAGVLAGGMKELVRESETADARLERHLGQHVTNPSGVPMVHVHLANPADTPAMLARLKAAGFALRAVSATDPGHLEGFVPLPQARAIAALAGVKSVFPVQRPMAHAGKVTSQATALQKADLAHAKGLDGTGIKIAALSDSFDACAACATHAADDVASGDLPANVFVQSDMGPGDGGEDEGRAMLQLVHDVAPGARLAFATAFNGDVDFANQILKLRSDFGADIIVDDVSYFDEPFYSDGVIAQAVDKVVASGAAYYSSAGNNGLEGYESEYRPIGFAEAEKIVAGGQGNLKLDQIPPGLRPKSIHLFKGSTPHSGDEASLSNRITVAAEARLSFQWNEPFNLGKVKTDYNLYIFDADGNWVDPLTSPTVYYSTDDNTTTDEAFEFIDLLPVPGEKHGGANSTTYQVVVGKVNDGAADRFKYIVENSLGESQFQNAPTMSGHAAAAGAIGVAAAYYAIPQFPEDFSSPGPVTIYFDKAGNALPEPVVRAVPQLTAADGVDTTFFGFDSDGNGLPNFFGTSAAAPDAAATAALVLQAAGGPGKLKPAELNEALIRTAQPIPVPQDRMSADARLGPVTFDARGGWTRWENYFGLRLDSLAAAEVTSIVLDASRIPLTFNTNLARFHTGESFGIDPARIKVSVSSDGKLYTLRFAPGTFTRGRSFRFGTSVFDPLQGSVQEDPDRLRGLSVTATMSDGSTFTRKVRAGKKVTPNRFTGAGLVNADAAIKYVGH